MKTLFTLVFILLISGCIFSQDITGTRIRHVVISNDTLILDSLNIYPSSVKIEDEHGNTISDKKYKIDYIHGLVIFSEDLVSKKLQITYKVFPVNLSKHYYNKDIQTFNFRNKNQEKPYIYRYQKDDKYLFNETKIKRQGSISRGISFGNNQDIIVNSSLNLQLSGKINNELNIQAAITDNNIPIQPDGNTQQIQDFDKVFISLYNEHNKLTVGDFEINKPTGYFMNLNKKVQGGIFSTEFNPGENKNNSIKSSISGAISKGKYNRMNFNGTEGNQGPYKLRGSENESYIIVIAGSEKVYIDGRLLKRGQENDYVMDYNTAEITFTPKQPITKDKRIIVEFEYSDKNYARFLLFNSNTYTTEKGQFWLNIFSDADSKNQTIQQDLDDSEKRILSQIGDSIQDAMVFNIDSVEFDNDQVLYKMTDTTVSSVYYDSVFIYSTNPDSAFYRLGFSYVGENNGHYIQIQSSANGRVFKWVAPANNVLQGNYEPVILLITPKKKQMINMGVNYKITKNTIANIELSATNNDVNTFSFKDADDNTGYALRAGIHHNIPLKDTVSSKLQMELNYNYIDQYFDPVERFRSTEFDRDWNLKTNKDYGTENYLNYNIFYKNKELFNSRYDFEYLDKSAGYSATRNNLTGNFSRNGFLLKAKGSYLMSDDLNNSTEFIRHHATISKRLYFLNLGVSEEQEINRWKDKSTDSLLGNSFSYNQWLAFIENKDTTKNHFNLSYKNRNDYYPREGQMRYATNAEDISASYINNSQPTNRFKTSVNYRKLSVLDTLVYNNNSEKNLTGRIEHYGRFVKKLLTTSTFFETGSGMEPKKEFNYLEVSPGQGVYKWTDYNGNNVKELDEFEVANFQDEANYIRVFTPTDNYIQTYVTRFNEMLYIRPKELLKKNTGFKGFISRFSDQFAYRINRKTLKDDMFQSMIPFIHTINDSSLISLSNSIKNQVSFNKTSPVYSIDYLYQATQNKMLLINGIDTRTNTTHTVQTRTNLNKYLSIFENISIGNKMFTSEFFSSKDYQIEFNKNDLTLRFQPNLKFRINMSYIYNEKFNKQADESGFFNNIGVELKYNVIEKGSFSLKMNYIKIKFNGETNTPVGYEILEGLLPGNNATWSLMYQQNLSKSLQININYNGRVSENSKVVHIAGVQMRAYF